MSKSHSPQMPDAVLDCGGKRSATPLSMPDAGAANGRAPNLESAVAAALCRAQSKL
jgi:hypothetical protein